MNFKSILCGAAGRASIRRWARRLAASVVLMASVVQPAAAQWNELPAGVISDLMRACSSVVREHLAENLKRGQFFNAFDEQTRKEVRVRFTDAEIRSLLVVRIQGLAGDDLVYIRKEMPELRREVHGNIVFTESRLKWCIWQRRIQQLTQKRAPLSASAGRVAATKAQPPSSTPRVKFSTTAGDIVVEVYADKAPKTVENFLQYVKDGHYDGTIFHRVIDNFIIQGGGYDSSYIQKPTRPPVAHEGREALAKGGQKNLTGTVAMARTADLNSATSQFFINVKDNASLDPVAIPPGEPVPRFEYNGRVYANVPRALLSGMSTLSGQTVFGKVVSGMDVVNTIRAMPTGPGGPFATDVPRTQVVIDSATLLN